MAALGRTASIAQLSPVEKLREYTHIDADKGGPGQEGKMKALNAAVKSLKESGEKIPLAAKEVMDAVTKRSENGIAVTAGVINANVAKLLAALEKKGGRTKKARKTRGRKTRRRGGDVAPRPAPGTSVRTGSVLADVKKKEEAAYDPFTKQATDRLSINSIPGAFPKKGGRSRRR